MLIKRLSIRIKCGFSAATFDFSPRMTLIHSMANSAGKSTLMRSLIYAMGEDIPSPALFRFADHEFRLDLEDGAGQSVRLLRHAGRLEILKRGGSKQTFSLPSETLEVRKALYGIENERVLGNILAAWFIEQDDGWQALNKGPLVGTKLRFSAKQLVAGLSERDLSLEEAQIAELSRQIKMIQVVQKATEYSSAAATNSNDDSTSPGNATLRERQQELLSEKLSLERELRSVHESLDHNRQFLHFVEGMKLQVATPTGEIVPVTSANLRGYNDEQGYLIARINVLKTRLSATNRELRKLNGLTQEDPRLFDIRSKDIDLDRAVSSLGLSSDELAPRLASLKRQRADLQKRYNAAISTQGNAAAARLESIIGSFANQLGEGDLFQSTKGGLYAASFADKTGAHHQLMVFAFRMGYAKIIEEYYGLKLPLVIDSPRGHELDATNGRKITTLLHNEFPDHQVIVASIYEDGFEEAEQRIELLDRIEERSEPIKNGSDSWAYEEYI